MLFLLRAKEVCECKHCASGPGREKLAFRDKAESF